MLKHLDLKQYSIANKIWLWGVLLLTFLLVIIILNTKQFALLGVEISKVTHEEVSTMNAIHELEVLIYKKTILRHQIISSVSSSDNPSINLQAAIRQYDDLSLQFAKTYEKLDNLMKDHAKLEMPSDKRRWKKLQAKRKKEIQAALNRINADSLEHNKLAHQAFGAINKLQRPEAIKAESRMLVLEKTMHEQLTQFSSAVYSSISSSENRILNIEYGARQISFFLMFWFSLIGLAAGYFIIRMIVSPIRNAVTFASEISDGVCSGPLEVTSSDELGDLSQALNRIAVGKKTNDKLA